MVNFPWKLNPSEDDMNRIHVAALAAGLAFATAPAAADTVLAQSTFDTGLDGWTSNEPSEIEWSATGGHPGGGVLFHDDINDGTWLEAPSKFLSGAIDFRKLDGKAYIAFQHEIVKDSGTGVIDYEIDMIGPGGTAVFLGGPPPQRLNKWFTVAAPLLEGNWTMASGSWKALMTDVTAIWIRVELVHAAPDVAAMDNITLVKVPTGFVPR